ncbi:MAG: hypothetical protein EBS49_03960 [Verrucomicrobia bacterium]|nr:hypothetical protein [Verrucomicrobiota bacterium]NBU68761.1 hypothetical protein [Verrucomicrobiota bacterium]
MKKITPFACALLFVAVTGYALTELNRFLDISDPKREAVVVTGKGVYYQPFRVDYLSGKSSILRRDVRIPVLTDRAARTNIGDSLEIVIGRGLLLKHWTSPADKHDEYNNFMFKVLHLGVFAGIFAFISFAYFRSVHQLPQTKKLGTHLILIAASIVVFYFV